MEIVCGTASLILNDHGNCLGASDLKSQKAADALDVMSRAVRIAKGRPIFFATDPSESEYPKARAFYEAICASCLGEETHDNKTLEVWMYK